MLRKLLAIMFTDMVGFTQVMQHDEQLGLQMRERHKDVLEKCHRAFAGEIVRYLGDGTLSLFSSAVDAVLCAIEIQNEFSKPLSVPLRIGIHLGHVIVEPDTVVGDAVNIASRMESFSIPGGVLISDAVQDQIKNQPQIQTVSLGKYRLKNVDRPYEIFAVSSAGLAIPDPAHLEGKGEKTAILPDNLPAPATPLIGREKEVSDVVGYLDENRIVTITGPGGMGKTRLAIEVSRRMADVFVGRIAFVPLATVSDSSRFVPSVASALNIKESEERSFRDGIRAVISDKSALLVLDNLEQIIDSAVDIADLVSTCPNLKILVTSRSPLKISAEQEYPLAPLPLPERGRLGSVAELMASPAGALFVDRARKANHQFQLTVENAPAVAEICHRLDGLPLALELAAARIRILPPDALLKRLTRSLDVLSRGPRDLPSRHQTLRATIDWSHSLLTEAEKKLFRRLAVFSGGFTIGAAEATCYRDDPTMLLDELESLIEKGLVQRAGELGRYNMLQTIKEYAWEKLQAAGETAEIRRDHALYYLGIAKRIHKGTQGDDQLEWMDRADREEANIRSALEWSLAAAEEGNEEAAELGLQLCGELWMYWHIRGMHISARHWVDAFLRTIKGQPSSPGACAALITAGLCSWTLGHYPRALEAYEASYRIAKNLEIDFEIALASCCLATCYLPMGELSSAAKFAGESIELCRKTDNKWMLGFSLVFDGLISFVQGNLSKARERYREALELQRKIGDYELGGLSLSGLAQLASVEGDERQAIQLYEEALASYARVGDRAEEARIYEELAWTSLKVEETSMARRDFSNSIEAYNEVGSVRGIGLAMLGLAACEQVEGFAYRAVQIAAAAERFSEEEGIANVYATNNSAQEYIENAKRELSVQAKDKAVEEGRRLSVEDALKMAREPVP